MLNTCFYTEYCFIMGNINTSLTIDPMSTLNGRTFLTFHGIQKSVFHTLNISNMAAKIKIPYGNRFFNDVFEFYINC